MVERTKLPETQKTSTFTIVRKEKDEEGGASPTPRVPTLTEWTLTRTPSRF